MYMLTKRCCGVVLLLGLLAFGAQAGTNKGFGVRFFGPKQIDDPNIGQIIKIGIAVTKATKARQVKITTIYDPNIVEFVTFTPETGPNALIPDLISLDATPDIIENGFAQIESGASQLGGSPGSGDGLIGILSFRVVGELENAPSFVSVVAVQINAKASDTDVITFAPRERGARLSKSFPNGIFNVGAQRRHNGAVLTWNTRFPGFNDVVRITKIGASNYTDYENPLNDRFSEKQLQAIAELYRMGIDLREIDDKTLQNELKDQLGLPVLPPGTVETIREIDNVIRSRSHTVPIPNLEPLTAYEAEIQSFSLDGLPSPTVNFKFRTRGEPDLRKLFFQNVDVQVTRKTAAISFGTNRPTSISYILREEESGGTVFQGTMNEDGEKRHRIAFSNKLQAGTSYEISVTASLLDEDIQSLTEAGIEGGTTKTFTRIFRTKQLERALRLLRPPAKVVGALSAQSIFATNQPVERAIVDYGLIPIEDDLATDDKDNEDDGSLYDMQTESVSKGNLHNVTLSDLDPSTEYRYRITLINAEGDTFSTDPRGNEQWSRDLRLTTSSEGDTLPAELIEGPAVDIRDVLAVVRFVTDVPTAASLFIGTAGSTYKTDDEFEFSDLTQDGDRRFSNFHSIIAAGLDRAVEYQYRLELETAAGKITVFEPQIVGATKIAKILQPPGGGGTFTTSNDPDTQFPVILSGPTVTTKTNDSAIIEWTTDEPADSEIHFGIDSTDDDSETSGISETSHKMTLSGLTAGTTYSFVAASTDASGNGASESSEAVFTTNPEMDLTAPSITVQPSVIYKNDQSATVQWSTDEDATGEVEFGTDQSLGFIRTLPTTNKVHEVTLTNLTASTEYYFTVSSSDISNNGPTTSDVLSFTTDEEPDITSPTITDIQVAASDSSAIINWQTDELSDSFVDFGTVSGLRDITVGSVEDVTTHEITITNLASNTEYFYTVGSIDRANNPATESTEASFSTLASADLTAPAVPKNLTGTPGNSQVALSWDANNELDLGGYNIYRRPSDTDSFSAIAIRIVETNYTDQGLINDKTYDYKITAIDREISPNESAVTDVLSLTPTNSNAPSVPTELNETGDNLLQPIFTFTNSTPFNVDVELTYTIQISTQSDFSNVTDSDSRIVEGAGDVGTGQTGWTITRELASGATYYWRVRAVENELVSPWSDTRTYVAKKVLLPGDFNNDLTVNLDDFFLFVDAFNQTATGDFAIYDLDEDETVGLGDFFLFVDNFGSSVAGKRWAIAHYLDEDALLSLTAEGGTISEQGVVTVLVHAERITNVTAFGIVLSYNPNSVSFIKAQPGSGHFLETQGGHAPLFRVLSDRPGQVVLGNGLVEGKSVSGQGLLAELTFRNNATPTNNTVFELTDAVMARPGQEVYRVHQLRSTQLRPTAFHLSDNFPNPFNPVTHIDFSLPKESPLQIAIYDVLGRHVRTIIESDNHGAGFYRTQWDGRDQMGRMVSNGVYFYHFASPSFQKVGKMLLLK